MPELKDPAHESIFSGEKSLVGAGEKANKINLTRQRKVQQET